MFDIGFLELMLIGIIALLVMGPERLPGAIRTGSLWLSRFRSSFQQMKAEIEREVGVDDIKQQLHNESILKNLEETKNDFEKGIQQTTQAIKNTTDPLLYDISHQDHSESPEAEKPADPPTSSL